MADKMPIRHIPVKHLNACQALARHSIVWQNMLMERVREIREARNLTQADLAAMTGLNQGFLSKLETGAANPTLDKIRIIAAALKVEPFELFAPSDIKGRAMLAMGEMDPAQQAAALVVLEAMARGQKR